MSSNNRGTKPGGHNQPVGPEDSTTAQPGNTAPKKPPRPGQCRTYTRKVVARSMPTIIGTFVDEAEKGSVSHFNQLAKFGGFDLRPMPAPAKRRGKSLVHRLLDEMKEHEAKVIAAHEARLAAERETGK